MKKREHICSSDMRKAQPKISLLSMSFRIIVTNVVEEKEPGPEGPKLRYTNRSLD